MELESRALQLIDRIYAAAVDPTCWQDFVEALSQDFEGAYVAFGLMAPDDPFAGTAYLVGITQEYRRSFAENLIKGLPFAGHFGPGSSKRFGDLGDLFPEVDLAESEFYRDWMEPQDLAPHWPIGCSIFLDGTQPVGWCQLWRRLGQPPFGAEDVVFCNTLLPHLHRALRIHLTLASSRHEGRALGEVIDRLPTGVILLDAKAQVVSANRSAQAILAQEDGFRLAARGPAASTPRDNEALRRAVGNAVAAEHPHQEISSGGFLAIERPSGRRPFVVMVTPLLAASPGSQMGDAVAALFVADPETGHVSATQVLENLYQLTHAEAELVRLLAAGKSLEEAARARGVTMNTARGQLKHVFAKTDTKRQGELVRLVLTGVGTLRDSS